MDDSKKRIITEETLKRTVEKMNPVLIKSLPASPEEILGYFLLLCFCHNYFSSLSSYFFTTSNSYALFIVSTTILPFSFV